MFMCVYYCSTHYKAVRVGDEGDNGGHVLRETTSRGLCGLVCPGTCEEPGTLTQGAPVLPGSSRSEIEPKTVRVVGEESRGGEQGEVGQNKNGINDKVR